MPALLHSLFSHATLSSDNEAHGTTRQLFYLFIPSNTFNFGLYLRSRTRGSNLETGVRCCIYFPKLDY
ncbi:hypothetical protein SLE2022_256870 [Rubroshorea leprosula]